MTKLAKLAMGGTALLLVALSLYTTSLTYRLNKAQGLLGGTTNLDALSLDGALTVTGATTLTGAATLSADPTLSGDDLTINSTGLRIARETLSTATTTPCSLQSPAATTTLQSFTANFTVGSTTAKSIIFTKGAAMQATTTALSGNLALAADAQGTFKASTTPELDMVISPSNWVQVSMVGGSGTDSPTGTCTAIFLDAD